MRVLVVSDSHGKNDDVKNTIIQVGKIDMFIHLGDVERGPEYIKSLVDCETHIIAGNNDWDLDLPTEETFMMGKYKVLITHGHRFYSSVPRMEEYALKNGYDIVMYGHTHVPLIHQGENVTILNPGSISYPRQEGRKQTYLLIDIDTCGIAHYSQGILKSSLDDVYRGFYR